MINTSPMLVVTSSKTILKADYRRFLSHEYREEDNLAQALHDNRDLLGHVHMLPLTIATNRAAAPRFPRAV